MTRVFKWNATEFERITEANWDSDGANQGLDGNTARLRWKRHIWQTNVLDIVEFNALQAIEGTEGSLTTTDYEDRNNDYVTYTGAICERVTGQHVGPNFEGVQAEFLVRLT